MKINKKNFAKMVGTWQKNSPGSLKDFFFDNIMDNLRWKGSKDVDQIIAKIISNNPEIVMNEMENYLDDDNDLQIAQSKPATKDNYIGIEIECFADMSKAEAIMLAVEYGVADWVDVSDDGSIEADYGRDFELRVLVKEKTLTQQMKSLAKYLKAGKFGVNTSCGLHVHLDMRNRNMKDIYARLLKFQDLMFGMVTKDRRANYDFCAYVNHYNQNQRSVAINKTSYEKHKTIEIRLHQGSVDVKQIQNWVNLLLKIINTTNAAPKSMKKKDAVIKWLGKSPKLTQYVKKTYEPDWHDNLHDDNFDNEDDVW